MGKSRTLLNRIASRRYQDRFFPNWDGIAHFERIFYPLFSLAGARQLHVPAYAVNLWKAWEFYAVVHWLSHRFR
jgi:hypothetical protein